MKITRPVLLAAFLFLTLPRLQAQVSTTDSLIQRAFASLKTKDEKAFLALYPDAQQFSRFTRSIMEQVMTSDAMKQIFAMDEKTKNMNIDSLIMAEVDKVSRPEEYRAMQEKFASTFRTTLKKGEEKGVKWSEARLTSYKIDSTAVADKEAEQFNVVGLKEAKGVIDFSVGDAAYQLAFDKMMFLPGEGGWFGIDFPQLARQGESLEPDASSANDAASTLSAPGQGDTNTKTKKPTTKKSSPKKSPARKKA